MLVVDPWHWLKRDGSLPFEHRETFIQCAQRPAKKPCTGLLWVLKTPNDEIVAFCTVCQHDEMLVHNWQETEWADGMMEPVPAEPEVDPRLH